MDLAAIVLVALIAGTLIGALLTRVLLRSRMHLEVERARSESQGERATLLERLASRETQLEDAKCAVSRLEMDLEGKRNEVTNLHEKLAEIAQQLKNEEEKLTETMRVQHRFEETFKALSSDALKSNNQSFLELAKATLERFQETARGDLEKRQLAIDKLVEPVKHSLEKFDAKLQDLEQKRVGAYEGLVQQVKFLADTQVQLRSETSNLVRALGTPRVRGRWGEIQLRRVVELAGMLDHCDFEEQVSTDGEDGKLRPDLVVHLPAGRSIVVDAKAPLAGYLEALEAQDEKERDRKLLDHTRQIRQHIEALSRKAYWDQFQAAPEFVVLFLPGEAFYSAALQNDPALIEQSVDQGVLIATPTTLIALLKAVAYGWRQERLAENAQEICELGKELYKRMSVMSGHIVDLGRRLGGAVDSYNQTIGSLESRVLVTARKFRDLEANGAEGEIQVMLPVDGVPRKLQAIELLDGTGE